MTDVIIQTVQRMTAEWQRALALLNQKGAGTLSASVRSDREEREEDAYNDLIEYVEDHGLNYSQYDPRGQGDRDE